MFAVRFTRAFGLAVALCFLSGAFTLTHAQDKKDVKKAKSKLKITVPQDDAKLQIQGKDTKPTGVTREFETPELEVGKVYEYDFAVTWEPNNYTKITRAKTIEFKGGDDISVDLTKADAKSPDKAVVRWVPTPDDIVEEMMKLGGNHPMGPLALADLIGLDTILAIMRVLHDGIGESKYRPCPLLIRYVDAGWHGRKSGKGFYDYAGQEH